MLEGASGAFVWVLALARDPEDFRNRVLRKMGSYELGLIELNEIQQYERGCPNKAAPELSALAETLDNERSVALYRFHTYGA